MSDLEIRGGVGPAEAAVIAAVVQHVLETEAAQEARPVSRPDLSAWTMASRAEWPQVPLSESAGRPIGGYSRTLAG
jgi:hypothetical protein